MSESKTFGQPMFEALKGLQYQIRSGQNLVVSGAGLSEVPRKEVGILVEKILRNAGIRPISDNTKPNYTSEFFFPNLPGFTLETMINEEWLTPQSVLAILFAWSAQRDLRDLED